MEEHPDSQTGQPQGQLNEKELRKLLDVGRALVAELDVETVLRHVLETARELTGARYAALGILDEGKEELERFVVLGDRRGHEAAHRSVCRVAPGCSGS